MMRNSALTLLSLLVAASAICAPDPSLKQVLFLGDRVHNEIVQGAQKVLKKKVRIHHPRSPVADHSAAALEHLDALLGDTKWDLIYLNFGLGDLHYRDPRTKSMRRLAKDAGGVRVADAEQYRKNVEALITRLKSTGCKIVWGSTTPILNTQHSYRLVDLNSEIEYNAIAAKVMAAHSIPILDLHKFIMTHTADDKKPSSYLAYAKRLSKNEEPLHQPLVATLQKELALGE